ncbi:TetR/AcrR family transcriptional regulator [Pseudomonas aeruginosa]|uniref:TetR/AcrR family transcriptional regulator n=1 Tax=Pseudomonas aeruginosa TaxID=287 RepID=UPI003D27C39F
MIKVVRGARARLLESGRGLMLSRGFCGTSINDLLHLSAVSRGSFYYHFKSKEEFGLELLVESYEDCFSGLKHVSQAMSVEECYARFVRWMGLVEAGSREKLRLIALLNAEVDRLPERLRIVLVQKHEEVINALASCVESTIMRIGRVEGDAYRLAHFLFGLWMGVAVLEGVQGGIVRPELNLLSLTSVLLE